VLDDADKRPQFRKLLQEQGIQTSVHYPPAHLFTQYREIAARQPSLDRTTNVSQREVTLPLHPLLEFADVDAISEQVWRAASRLQEQEKAFA
jgi:dTDP-4-amino-4,6-dideoxygalactose transaminase